MPRPLSAIQTEIASLEAEIAKAIKVSSAGVDGGNVVKQPISVLQARLDRLYVQADRASGAAPMFPRGVITGLR